jgi:peptidoglycan/xylan/chitin deacetylase (PgdA/CDA1 family)
MLTIHHGQQTAVMQREMTEPESTGPPLRRPMIRIVLHVMRLLGAFKLALLLSRRRVRILGYHGIALGDLHMFAPFLFMRESTFRRRLEIVRKRHMNVISLDEALRGLQAGCSRGRDVVITIDDGWWSTLEFAAPLLKHFDYPATLYLATRHAVDGTPVAAVVLGYMLWKRDKTQVQLENIDPSVDGIYDLGSLYSAAHVLLERKITHLAPELQARALRQIAERLGLEEAPLTADKRFRMIAVEDIPALAQLGVDTQLHTHDHLMPLEFTALREQLEQNAQYIRRYRGGEPPRHFCYPSGEHRDEHPLWLAQLGILSATTCDTGMNRSGQNPYLLRRFLDSESISEIEFEANICGIFELAALARTSIGRCLGR